jgi:hypothetical protein
VFTGCADIHISLHSHVLCSNEDVEDLRFLTDIFMICKTDCMVLTVFTEYSDDIQNRPYDFDLCLQKILVIPTVRFYYCDFCMCCFADMQKRLCNKDLSLQEVKMLNVKLSCNKSRGLRVGTECWDSILTLTLTQVCRMFWWYLADFIFICLMFSWYPSDGA